MKILIATESYYPNIDGGAIAQHNLALELSKKGHDVRIITPGTDFKNKTEKEHNTIIYRTRAIKLPLYMNSRYFFSPFPIFRINKIIKEFKPDIVNICSPYPVGMAAFLSARKHKIPVIGSIHVLPQNMITPFYRLNNFKKIEQLSWMYLVYFFNLVNWTTIPTKTGANMYKEHGLKTGITPISNGLRTDIFKPENDGEYLREKYNLPKKNIILCSGRINEEKNLDVLIKAIPHVVKDIDAHFLFVGEGGDYKQWLINYADKLGVKNNTTFTDFLDWSDYPNIYDLADLFALPSEAELQSLVTMEAVASGLPVVVVNKGALPELASNDNGLIFDAQNSKQMAECIKAILSDKKTRNSMGKKSLELIKKHSLDSVATQFEDTYKMVIDKFNKKH